MIFSFERFSSIAKEYGYNDSEIVAIWNGRPGDDLDEERLRKAFSKMSARRDELRMKENLRRRVI